MGCDQCTVPDTTASCWTYLCCFHLALANVHPWPLVPFLQISLKNIVNLKPTTIIPFGIVACTFSENASRNSCLRINASDGLVRINEDLRVIVSCCTKVKNEGKKKTGNWGGRGEEEGDTLILIESSSTVTPDCSDWAVTDYFKIQPIHLCANVEDGYDFRAL